MELSQTRDLRWKVGLPRLRHRAVRSRGAAALADPESSWQRSHCSGAQKQRVLACAVCLCRWLALLGALGVTFPPSLAAPRPPHAAPYPSRVEQGKEWRGDRQGESEVHISGRSLLLPRWPRLGCSSQESAAGSSWGLRAGRGPVLWPLDL